MAADGPGMPLRYSEAAYLANHLRILIDWDLRACVRLQQRGSVIGIFGAPPTGCVSFIALPLAVPAAAELAGIDRTVSAGRLRDILGDVSVNNRTDRSVGLPDPVTGPAELAVLPPAGPWQAVASGFASEVGPVIDTAIAEFRRRIPDTNADTAAAQRVAHEIWSRPGWSAVPIRALHTARSLGFLAKPDARIDAATTTGWTRLVTPAGQVFAADDIGSLSLRLLT